MTHLKDVVSRWFGKVPSKKKKHNVSPESTMEGFFASELGVSKIQQAPAKGIFLPWWSLVTAICLAKYTACSKILKKSANNLEIYTHLKVFFSNGAVRSYNSEGACKVNKKRFLRLLHYISIFFFQFYISLCKNTARQGVIAIYVVLYLFYNQIKILPNHDFISILPIKKSLFSRRSSLA